MALAASPISWSSPGIPEYPLSSPYARLIEVLVTPVSVEPLACPLPHGEGSVPNLVVEIADDDAPLAIGATATPAAVTTMLNTAKIPALMPILLLIVNPHLLFIRFAPTRTGDVLLIGYPRFRLGSGPCGF